MSNPAEQTNEQRYFDTLKRIAHQYDTVEQVKKSAGRRYGLEPDEALEMAYENLQNEARVAIKGKRRPKI